MDETLIPPPRCARTPRRVVIRVLSVMALMLAGCAGDGGVHNEGGSATTYRDSSQRGPVSGVGIEGQDIVAMTDAMMRDLLQVPLLAAAATPPRVINDAAHFRNDRSQRIDRNLIADRLADRLRRADWSGARRRGPPRLCRPHFDPRQPRQHHRHDVTPHPNRFRHDRFGNPSVNLER